MKLGLKATLITVVIFVLCLSAVAGVTQSWYSDEERATIDVSTAAIGVDSFNGELYYFLYASGGKSVPMTFDNNTATSSDIPNYNGQLIMVGYLVDNKSSVDSFLTININLVGIDVHDFWIEVKERDTGRIVDPIDVWYYGMVPGKSYRVDMEIKVSSTGTGSVSITNKPVLNTAEVPVTTEFDLKRAIASSNLNKPIVVSGDIVCSSPIEIGRTLTLGIDGTIKTDGREAITVSSGTLTLSNRGSTSIVQSESYDGATVRILPGAYMNLNGVSIKSDGYGISVGNIDADPSDTSAILLMKNGIIDSFDSAIIVGTSSHINIKGGNLTSSNHVIRAADPSSEVVVHVEDVVFNAKTSVSGKAVCGIFANSPGDWAITSSSFNITNGIEIVARSGDVLVYDENTYNYTNGEFDGGQIDSYLTIETVSRAAAVAHCPLGTSYSPGQLSFGLPISVGDTISYYSSDGIQLTYPDL